jgi:outer membrane protein
MMGREESMTIVKAFIATCSIFALSIDVVHAADLTTGTSSSSVAPPESFANWFLRIGLLGTINQSSSRLYAQPAVGIFGVGPQLLLAGRGESFSNLLTVSVQAGYFVTPHWSVEISGGLPVWQTARITGVSTTGPAAGTILTKPLPAAVPITIVYHLPLFWTLQPYVGAGVAPIFALRVRDAFAAGSSAEPSVGLVLQGGYDYMFSQNWGVFFDAKKYFDRTIAKATGLSFGPPVGIIHAAATSVTNSQPWVLTTGLTYRF